MASGAGETLAVGEGGLIARLVPGGAWTRSASPVAVSLHAVALRLDEAVAVGDDGTILVRARGAWHVEPKTTPRALRAVAFTSFGVVAAGDGGVIVRRLAPGEPFRVEPSGTTRNLLGVCAGLRDVSIVGRDGTILGHAPFGQLGAPWSLHASPTRASLFGVACDGDDAAAAVGDGGTLLERLQGGAWRDVSSGTRAALFAIAAPFGTRSWLAAGAGGTAVRPAGAPQALATGRAATLRAATDGPLGTFLGGDDGILRVEP